MPNPIPTPDESEDQTVIQVLQLQDAAMLEHYNNQAQKRRNLGKPAIKLEKIQQPPRFSPELKDLKAELQLEYNAALEKLETKKT